MHRLLAVESDSEWLPTWDGQTQRYLSIIATGRSLRATERRGPFTLAADSEVLVNLRHQLTYPAGYATPRSFDPSEIDRLLRELRQSMSH